MPRGIPLHPRKRKYTRRMTEPTTPARFYQIDDKTALVVRGDKVMLYKELVQDRTVLNE